VAIIGFPIPEPNTILRNDTRLLNSLSAIMSLQMSRAVLDFHVAWRVDQSWRRASHDSVLRASRFPSSVKQQILLS
jgi:hypothetical protein